MSADPHAVPSQEEATTARRLDQTEHIALLSKYGIKVRDFAYESKLPPIHTAIHIPLYVAPSTRPFKRSNKQYNLKFSQNENAQAEFVQGSSQLNREDTEPVDPSSQTSEVTRPPIGFTDLGSYLTKRLSATLSSIGQLYPSTPKKERFLPGQILTPSAHTWTPSQPGLAGESQKTEDWVDTPLVTPNGSLQWNLPVHDTSGIPASQLDNPMDVDDDHDIGNDIPSRLDFSSSPSPPPSFNPNLQRPQFHSSPSQFAMLSSQFPAFVPHSPPPASPSPLRTNTSLRNARTPSSPSSSDKLLPSSPLLSSPSPPINPTQESPGRYNLRHRGRETSPSPSGNRSRPSRSVSRASRKTPYPPGKVKSKSPPSRRRRKAKAGLADDNGAPSIPVLRRSARTANKRLENGLIVER
ncbi:hypothetical protein C8Q75DRAFT_888063 [Abortiporus biennis]|nr:hypothetical protein C8Q75DRAFT_888063 [Abortiporus biennis]